MQIHFRRSAARRSCTTVGLLLLGLVGLGSPGARGQAWRTHSHDAQHSADAGVASLYPQTIRWKTPVDLDPQYASGGVLYTHYGSPVITTKNTVLVPVKTAAYGSFRLEAHSGATGALLWLINSDYVPPSFNWIPPFGPSLTPDDAEVVMPGAGGTVLIRNTPDSGHGNLTRVAFYNTSTTNYYGQDVSTFNSAIQISTPITVDGAGNIYFGYLSSGVALPGYPNGIPSGLARIAAGQSSGTFVAATKLSGTNNYATIAVNCAPAVTVDASSVYVAVNAGYSSDGGYLCKASATTLVPSGQIFLVDPQTQAGALVSGDSSATPTIGPDGDVYYGVLETSPYAHRSRGWLLHFNSALTVSKIPGSFGWDDTASVVPASLVPSYTGTSKYLLLTKYNNYYNAGGDGMNKLCIQDPNATENDLVFPTVQVMKEVLTILGPTLNTPNPGVREWCINSAAIDSINKCAVVNSEDGHIYRWSFTTNTLSDAFPMAAATGEAYTSTLIGPDGANYCINNAELYCCQPSIANAASVRALESPRSRRAGRAARP
jgi:hypothetical protein